MPDTSSVTRADVRMKFYTRFAILGAAALGVSGWFFYDGLVNWPRQAEVWNAYNALKPESESGDHAHEGHGEAGIEEHGEDFPQDEWEALITERGWSDAVNFIDGQARQPMGKLHSDFAIRAQLYLGALCIPIGLAFFLKVLLARGMWIESDGESVTSSWGQGFRYADVVEINKRKWRDKGLAYVKHNHQGKAGRFVIDDLKFDRKATDAILYDLEQAVGVDKIVGGRPEEAPEPGGSEPGPSDGGDAPAEPVPV